MKKLLTILILSGALVLTGCSSGPDDTLEEMRDKMCKQNSMAPLLDYTAPESQGIMQMIVVMSNDANKGKEIKGELKNKCQSPFKVRKVEKNGDTARVYTFDNEEPIEMRKVDGKWKMVIRK